MLWECRKMYCAQSTFPHVSTFHYLGQILFSTNTKISQTHAVLILCKVGVPIPITWVRACTRLNTLILTSDQREISLCPEVPQGSMEPVSWLIRKQAMVHLLASQLARRPTLRLAMQSDCSGGWVAQHDPSVLRSK